MGLPKGIGIWWVPRGGRGPLELGPCRWGAAPVSRGSSSRTNSRSRAEPRLFLFGSEVPPSGSAAATYPGGLSRLPLSLGTMHVPSSRKEVLFPLLQKGRGSALALKPSWSVDPLGLLGGGALSLSVDFLACPRMGACVGGGKALLSRFPFCTGTGRDSFLSLQLDMQSQCL